MSRATCCTRVGAINVSRSLTLLFYSGVEIPSGHSDSGHRRASYLTNLQGGITNCLSIWFSACTRPLQLTRIPAAAGGYPTPPAGAPQLELRDRSSVLVAPIPSQPPVPLCLLLVPSLLDVI